MKKIVLALIVCLWACRVDAAITFVSPSLRAAQGGVSFQTTLALSTTTTDLIVAFVWWDQTADTMTVTDSGSHIWTALAMVTNGGSNRAQMFYAYGSAITAGGPTVTATLSAGSGLINLEVLQFAGTSTASDPFDVQANGTGTGTAQLSGPFTTTTADQVIVAGGFVTGAGACDTAAAIGGTTATLGNCTTEYRIVSATQTGITAQINNGQSNPWSMVVGTFKQASGGVVARPCIIGGGLICDEDPSGDEGHRARSDLSRETT